MRRSDTVSFVDQDSIDLKKAFCPKCEENLGKWNKLVPRYVKGILDDNFKECSFCGELQPIYHVKFEAEYEPKGFIADNPFESGAKVVVKDDRRKSRRQHRNRPLVNEDLEIPKFAGKKDEFLEKKIKEEGGIIVSLDDSWDLESSQ